MSHWQGGIFPQPGFSLELLLSGPNSWVGSETPKGTPSFSVRGNSQSGSPERDAKRDTKSRRKGCPGHRSWRCLGPRIALVNPGPGKGHDQGAQSSQWGNFPKRGVLPMEGFPPPSLSGRERKPNWTIATRSVRCGTLKAVRPPFLRWFLRVFREL